MLPAKLQRVPPRSATTRADAVCAPAEHRGQPTHRAAEQNAERTTEDDQHHFDRSDVDDVDLDDDTDEEIPAHYDPDHWDDFGADFDQEEPEPEQGDFWPESDDEAL